MENTDALRKDLLACGFDADKFIESQISDVTDIDINVESKMLIIFDGLSKELAFRASELESEVSQLRKTAHTADEAMLVDMEGHAKNVDAVRLAVDEVKVAFERASEGAIKIGDRLSVSEAERRRVETAMNLINFINWYDEKAFDHFDEIHTLDLAELVDYAVPEAMAKKGWSEISRYLGYSRRTLLDLSTDCAQRALKNILKVSEASEEALLGAFFRALDELMEESSDTSKIKECRELVEWLHSFNNGQTLHKRFIYAVITKRMPNTPGEGPGPTNRNAPEKELEQSPVDTLSELFGTIRTVCREQFEIIRNVFPAAIVPQMSRTLIQRIYHDPAFGIQSRVESVLHPEAPLQPLPLPDYLESLLTVREKLAALYIILQELCSHPSVRGMGRENSVAVLEAQQDDFGIFNGKMLSVASDKGSAEERLAATEKSMLEVHEFLDEQNTLVLSAYMGSYFDKEQTHVRNQYGESLRRALGAAAATMITGAPDATPRLRADRATSLADFHTTVCNTGYLQIVQRLTTDSALRMQSIARDSHKLSVGLKDLFVLQLEFLLEGVIVPCMKECSSVLYKRAKKGPTNNALPPMEYLKLVAFACGLGPMLRAGLEEVFIKPLREANNNNMVVACREYLLTALKPVESLCKEGLVVWGTCVVHFVDRQLTSMQLKGDYASSSFLQSAINTPTSAACDAVCAALKTVTSAVRELKVEFVGLDIGEQLLKPLGRHVIGTLIAHLRRLRISEEGSARLLSDLQKYLAAIQRFDYKDHVDMMLCLQEIAQVFTVTPMQVRKVVVENLRHLDTDLVLALTRARADYGVVAMGSDHWTRTIATTYAFSKWDHELPWEKKRRLRAANAHVSTREEFRHMAPTTLRKTNAPVSSLYMDAMRPNVKFGGAMKDATADDPSAADDALSSITGPARFAAAMTSRFAGFALPPMPTRPVEPAPTVESIELEPAASDSHRPLGGVFSMLSRAPEPASRNNNNDRESAALSQMAKSILTGGASSSAPATRAPGGVAAKQEPSMLASARESTRNMFSFGSANKAAPVTPEPAKPQTKSHFGWLGFK